MDARYTGAVSYTHLDVYKRQLIGLFTAYFGGILDTLFMRLVDVMMSFPVIVLIIAIIFTFIVYCMFVNINSLIGVDNADFIFLLAYNF